ncbi:MAG: serine/threonine-protein kinase [Deltaproteobacteria bacterium]|nr:serine/threonine-protein kinase [Deltaproteobacteria bacterium]
MARALKPLTADTLQDEVRFLLKTLLRDDLFGDDVGVSEAEKLLESSLSVGFVEYCAFLKRHAFLDIDRTKNTITVLPRGKNYADGNSDPSLGTTIAAHFAKQLGGAPGSSSSSFASSASPPLPSFSASSSSMAPGDSVFKARPVDPAAKQKAAATMALLDRERYVRGEVIGQGSLGVVMLGKDTTLERDVVVKEVRHVYELVTYLSRDEITTRIKAAVMAQARLDHPHVLRVVDVQFGGDAPTIVLDRALESLATRVGRGIMPVDVVIRVLLQICYGLAHAHAQGIVHAGLKPENVLFDKSGNVKLADFGIARVTERTNDPSTSAPPVYVGRGHPSYMAPEQLHKGKASAAGDVYALGILLYEMLTGNLPGRRSPMPSASERVVAAVGVDKVIALDDLFDRMTRDPLHERFANIEEVLKALYAAFPGTLVGTPGTLLLSETDPLAPVAVVDAAPAIGDGIVMDGSEMEGSPEVTAITKAPAEMQ